MMKLNNEQVKLLRFFAPTAKWIEDTRPLERSFVSQSGKKATIFDAIAPTICKVKYPTRNDEKSWSDDTPQLRKGITLHNEIMPSISKTILEIIKRLEDEGKINPSKVTSSASRKIGVLCHGMTTGDIASMLAHEGGHFASRARSRYLSYENIPITLEGLTSNKANQTGHPTHKHASQVIYNIINTNDKLCKLLTGINNGTHSGEIPLALAHDLRYLIASLASLPEIKKIESGDMHIDEAFKVNDYSFCDFLEAKKITPNYALDKTQEFFGELERQL